MHVKGTYQGCEFASHPHPVREHVWDATNWCVSHTLLFLSLPLLLPSTLSVKQWNKCPWVRIDKNKKRSFYDSAGSLCTITPLSCEWLYVCVQHRVPGQTGVGSCDAHPGADVWIEMPIHQIRYFCAYSIYRNLFPVLKIILNSCDKSSFQSKLYFLM